MKIAFAPITSAQLTAAERKCALRNGTYVTGISASAVPTASPDSGTAMPASAGDSHQRHPPPSFAPRKPAPLLEHIVQRSFRPAIKRIRRVAPGTAKIAPRQPPEQARQSPPRPFPRNDFKLFGE